MLAVALEQVNSRFVGCIRQVDATPSDVNLRWEGGVAMGRGRLGLSAIDKREIWSRWKAGETLHEIGRAYGKCHNTIRAVLLPRGGIPPLARGWRSHSLSEKTSREGLLPVRRFVRSPVVFIGLRRR